MRELSVIGGGSWGTALAIVLSPRFHRVRLWVYEKDLADRMESGRTNDVYLPDFPLPSNVRVSGELPRVLEGADVVLSVMPSHLVRALYEEMLPLLTPSMLLVSATKGLENGTLLRMSEIITAVVSRRFQPAVAVISGPTFAREVAAGEPTALVVASPERSVAEAVQNAFAGPTFRLYSSTDPVGVEVGGAVKNVVAIGAGVCHGLGLGSNALAALVTRGLAEITRLAVAMGGQPRTLSGLAGLGDLVLTCTGALSRNRSVGVELAHGRRLADIVGSMQMVAEGVKTTTATVDLARRHGVETPISAQMFEMLQFGISPREALRKLMDRSLKGEF